MDVTVERVSWSAGGRTILTDISLTVTSGEFVGVIGPNGAGKSSLLRCVYRMNRPSFGNVRVGGDDVWHMSAQESARRTAAVLQNSEPEGGFTVREVVTMGRTPHKRLFDTDTPTDRAAVSDALQRAGLSDLADRQMGTLSGGERQRAMLARAIAQASGVLVLDEPTNHLDPRYQVEILRMARGLNVTVLATFHDLNLAAAYCDRLVVLENGTVALDAAPEEVLSPDRIQRVFGLGADVDRHPRTGLRRITYHH